MCLEFPGTVMKAFLCNATISSSGVWLFANTFSSDDPETVGVVLEKYPNFLQTNEECDFEYKLSVLDIHDNSTH